MQTSIFNNKLVLVTGAAKGIGYAVSSAFVEQGASVVMTDIDMHEVSAVARDLGGKAIAKQLDVTCDQAWQDLVEDLGQQYESLDVLVNNAGIGSMGDLETLDLASWNQTLAVNTTGVFLGSKRCIKLLKNSKAASIINIASVHSSRANPNSIHYSASKAAVLSLTESIALHCTNNKYPIRCNAIQPGYIHTPMLDTALENSPDANQVLASLEAMHPIGNIGQAEDIAEAAIFLASDKAKFITGTSLAVDGGFLCK